jgi:hypothetical protein
MHFVYVCARCHFRRRNFWLMPDILLSISRCEGGRENWQHPPITNWEWNPHIFQRDWISLTGETHSRNFAQWVKSGFQVCTEKYLNLFLSILWSNALIKCGLHLKPFETWFWTFFSKCVIFLQRLGYENGLSTLACFIVDGKNLFF